MEGNELSDERLRMIIKEYKITKDCDKDEIERIFNQEYFYLLFLSNLNLGYTPLNFHKNISHDKLIININIKEKRGTPLTEFLNSQKEFNFSLFTSFLNILAILEKQKIILIDINLSIFEVCDDNSIKIADLAFAISFKDYEKKKIKNFQSSVFLPPEIMNLNNLKVNYFFANSFIWGMYCLALLRMININDGQEIKRNNAKNQKHYNRKAIKKLLSNFLANQNSKNYSSQQRVLVYCLIKQALSFTPERRPTFLEMDEILKSISKINIHNLKNDFGKRNTIKRYANYLRLFFADKSQHLLSELEFIGSFDGVSFESFFEIVFKEYFPKFELIQKAIEDRYEITQNNQIISSNKILSMGHNNAKITAPHSFQNLTSKSIHGNITNIFWNIINQGIKENRNCSIDNYESEDYFPNYHIDYPEIYDLLISSFHFKEIEHKKEVKVRNLFSSNEIESTALMNLILNSNEWNFREFNLNFNQKLKIFTIIPDFPQITEFTVTYFDYDTWTYNGITGGIGNMGISMLKTFLPKKNFLITLNISAGPSRKNPISDHELLNQVLECLVQLENLDLSFNNIDGKRMTSLCSGFRSLMRLEKLNLEGTFLDNIGLKYLTEYANQNNFTHLNLARNNLSTSLDSSQDPKKNLCDLIRNSSRLFYLNISCNQFEKNQLIGILHFISISSNSFPFIKHFVYQPKMCVGNEYQEI